MTGVDTAAAVRGASRGFTVLLLGGVVQPWVATLLPPMGFVWLAVVAVTAFVFAAVTAGGAAASWQTTVAAAAGAYLLVLPLVASAGAIDPTQVAGTGATAVVIGFATPLGARAIGRGRDVQPQAVRPS